MGAEKHVGCHLSAYLSPQLGTGYAPVAEHDDGHFLGNRRGQFPEQFHRGIHPGAALGGPVDAPGHGNGATPVDHADDDGGGLVAFERGQRPGPAVRNATGKDPPEQCWKQRLTSSSVWQGRARSLPSRATPGDTGGSCSKRPRARGRRPRRSGRRCQREWPRRPTGPDRSTVVGRGEVDAFQ